MKYRERRSSVNYRWLLLYIFLLSESFHMCGFSSASWEASISYLQPWQKLLHMPSDSYGKFLWLSPSFWLSHALPGPPQHWVFVHTFSLYTVGFRNAGPACNESHQNFQLHTVFVSEKLCISLVANFHLVITVSFSSLFFWTEHLATWSNVCLALINIVKGLKLTVYWTDLTWKTEKCNLVILRGIWPSLFLDSMIRKVTYFSVFSGVCDIVLVIDMWIQFIM